MANLGECLIDIADSIRAKTGTTNKMKIEEMPALIIGIETGGNNPFEGVDIEDIKGIIAEMTVVDNEQFKDVYLKEIRLPKVEQLGGYILGSNSITETLELGERLTEISPFQISECSSLKTLILQGFCSLVTDPSVTFGGTSIANGTGTVYVPDRYLEQYKNDTYWSEIASQIKPLSEYYGIEVEGAVTGIDPTWTDWTYFSYRNNRNSLVEKLKYSDTSNGTTFYGMFQNCNQLTMVPKIDTHNGTDFKNMFSGCVNLTEIPEIDTSNGTNFYATFSSCKITTIPQINTSKGTDFSYMFKDCAHTLLEIPEIDTSNGTNFQGMFQSCAALVTIPKINVSKITSYARVSNMFSSCTNLQNVTFEGVFPVLNNISVFSGCPNLTVDSLMSFINALENNSTTTYKVTIGATNLAKLTSDQIRIATNKRITLA